jgi:CubicO group peptidase (beta-lactamase class C family)/predicted dienelactone hydrolase
VTYPAATGAFPVILFGHKFGGTKDQCLPLVSNWVSRGYVCIQPNHSDSPQVGGPTPSFNTDDRAADMAFLMDSFDAIEAGIPAVSGKLDRARIGVGGQYIGGQVAGWLVGARSLPLFGTPIEHDDPRVKAALMLSPEGVEGSMTRESWVTMNDPVMVMTGSDDPSTRTGNPPEWRTEPWQYSLPGDKYLAFIEGFNGLMDGLMTGSPGTNYAPYVQSLTLAFWDSALKSNAQATTWLNSDELPLYSRGHVALSSKQPTPVAFRGEAGPFFVEEASPAWHDAARGRDVAAHVYAPEMAAGNGPFPVALFSPAFGETRDSYGYLGRWWARYGYIAIVLNHAGSDAAALLQGNPYQNMLDPALLETRAGDLRFALGQALSGATGLALLDGRADSNRVAVAGHSLGGDTASALWDDTRAACFIALAPGFQDGFWGSATSPVLVAVGSADTGMNPAQPESPAERRVPYDEATAVQKHLLTLSNAAHHAFSDSDPWWQPGAVRDPLHHPWICENTLAFLDACLRDNRTALFDLNDKSFSSRHPGDASQENTLPAYDFSGVDAFLDANLERYGWGAAVAILHNGRLVYRKGHGYAKPDFLPPIASATKWISGGLIMSLVDTGHWTLDDTAAQHLPENTNITQTVKSGMSIRQMFSHTHGWADGTPADFEPPNYKPHHDTSITLQQAADIIAAVPLEVSPPGSGLYYSGIGMQLAAAIAERVTTQAWIELFNERIGGPLEMTRTTYYAFDHPEDDTENPNCAGSIETCVDDYCNFLRMLLDGGTYKGRRVLGTNAVEAMLRNQTGHVSILRTPYLGLDGFRAGISGQRYGIGCWLTELDPACGYAQVLMSGGAFGCHPLIDRRRNLAVVFMPYANKQMPDGKGNTYNDAHAVFLQMMDLVNATIPLSPAIFHVSPTGSHTPPFASWSHAATNIQSAINLAVDGDTVRVGPGHYRLATQLVVRAAIALTGSDGSALTMVDGNGVDRCLYANANALISGFTFTNGAVTGSGGGGIYLDGAGTVSNCVLTGNRTVSTNQNGGAAYLNNGGVITHCQLVANQSAQYAAAVWCSRDGLISDCVISDNHAADGCGGVFLSLGGTARRCDVRRNSPCGSDMLNGGTFENCIFSDNAANGVTIWNKARIRNCTFTGNGNAGITVYSDGDILVENTIAWSNTLADFYNQPGETNWIARYSCASDAPPGNGNITNHPRFADYAAGDLSLAADSPCIDAADPSAAPTNDIRLAPRPLDGNGDGINLPDVGAHEFISDASDTDRDGMPDGWEWRHGLDLLGDDATLDPDGDGADNRSEYVAGTDPGDPQSLFQCLGTVPEGFPTPGNTLKWSSATGRVYTLRFATNLTTGFREPLAENLAATPPVNRHTDTVQRTGAVFYRVEARRE